MVENLGNTYDEGGDEMASLRDACRELQRIARSTHAHVMGLHHVMGAKENGDKPIYLGDLIGKIGKIPEQVIGLNFGYRPDQLHITVPKQRGGRRGFEFDVPINYNNAQIGGYVA